MIDKKKVQKTLGRKCPQCEGVLEVVNRVVNKQGVCYNQRYIECTECDYKEKLKNKYHESKEDDNLDNGW